MAITPQSATVPLPESQRNRVALCEPDALLRSLLGEWLERAAYEPLPEVAARGTVALVVADLPAPRQGGAARIAALRQRFPGAKVLVISGQFMACLNGATAAALALGADAVLAKPFSSAVFIDAVRAIVPLASLPPAGADEEQG